AIVGSVGRYKDFTRSFLPLKNADERRWAAVGAIAKGLQGFPPIEVYQIGDVYFVLDGNHRVSVARQLDAKYIEAYVTKIQTKVPLARDIHADDLALKAEYADFLTYTNLDQLRPEADLTMSIPGGYRKLRDQIEEHRYYMGLRHQREIPLNEAVLDWYETIYLPIIGMIHRQDLLNAFPNRTVTDLYLWISEYRAVIRRGDVNQLEEDIAELPAKLAILPYEDVDALILNAEYANFLEHTRIQDIRPDADLRVTAPGRYRELEKQIDIHHYFMGLEYQRDVPYQEAVAHWYDTIYLPLVSFICKRGMLRDFPNRTATDLYLWILEYRTDLEKRLGWRIQPEAAATDLVHTFSGAPERVLSRMGEKVLDALTPDELESGPATGAWRKEEVTARRTDRLFTGILVPISGSDQGWMALDQAILMARYEKSHIYGLHVMPSQTPKAREKAAAIQSEFTRRCDAVGVQGELAIETGSLARTICDRARWTDLVVLNLTHPQKFQPFGKLKSDFRTILRRCSRPVLAVPRVSPDLRRVLLAYDGSPKADEALFVGAYLSGHLNLALVVITVKDVGRTSVEALSLAREYLLRRKVQATFVEQTGPVGDAILATADAQACDLILMGGYGLSPVLEMMFGSTVDNILRTSQRPTLICR
ncbi:hypothetical protein GF339_05465, partial [candidate division KSB3 bacterium]|nr:hypothetical protein [candidate division KSB3 bacterium]MBD3324011.1 hypothetical protein [candidate division KSB3 bacterium]